MNEYETAQKLTDEFIKSKNTLHYANLSEDNRYLGWGHDFNFKLPEGKKCKDITILVDKKMRERKFETEKFIIQLDDVNPFQNDEFVKLFLDTFSYIGQICYFNFLHIIIRN